MKLEGWQKPCCQDSEHGEEGHAARYATLDLVGERICFDFWGQVSHLSGSITLLSGRKYLPMGNSDLIITASGNYYNFQPAFYSSNLVF